MVERDQILVIRRLDNRMTQWCTQCSEPAQMVSIDEAAAIVPLSARAIYQKVEMGQVHFAETKEGFLLVCLNSIK